MSVTVKEELKKQAGRVEAFLECCLSDRGIPEKLRQAMEYSLLAGGKRLRPVLCLTWAELNGMEAKHVMPFAASLELIHTYSLIHDDLPAMDNDDLRRGKPTNHVVHGEAMAILAGDGLLTESFCLMCETAKYIPAERVLRATYQLATAAGASGMVGGQAVDMNFTGRDDISFTELRQMHSMKTGALIRAACQCGAILAGADEVGSAKAYEYGASIGVAFQIVDDILDIVGDEKTLGKPVGSDVEEGKCTYPSLMGLDESRAMANAHIADALDRLDGFDSPQADFLRRLARYIVERAN